MRVLFIVHAISWSDKASLAAEPIAELIREPRWDAIIELVPSRADIRGTRYLAHHGIVFEHDNVSPVPFLAKKLFGQDPLFPRAHLVTLVGGVANATGGGCLNVAFDHLMRYQQRLKQSATVRLPLRAIYQAQGRRWCPADVEGFTRDLVSKLSNHGVPFELLRDGVSLQASHQGRPLVLVDLDTSGTSQTIDRGFATAG